MGGLGRGLFTTFLTSAALRTLILFNLPTCALATSNCTLSPSSLRLLRVGGRRGTNIGFPRASTIGGREEGEEREGEGEEGKERGRRGKRGRRRRREGGEGGGGGGNEWREGGSEGGVEQKKWEEGVDEGGGRGGGRAETDSIGKGKV